VAARRLRSLAGIGLAAVTAVVVWAATIAATPAESTSDPPRSEAGADPKADPLPVQVVPVGSVDGPDLSSRYAGVLIPDRESVLGFERGGRVAAVHVSEGDVVGQGDLIAELDQQDLDAAEKRVRGELAAAEAKLAELIAGPREQTIEAARARVEELAARVAQAKLEANRQRQLAPRGATSNAELDSAVYGLQASENSLLAARAALEELSAGTRVEQIAAQRARCDSIAAQLEEIQSQRDDSRIVAPFDGSVARRLIDEGTVVTSSVAVVEVVSERCEAQVGLPPTVAAQLAAGDPVLLHLRRSTRPATIDRIEPRVRRDTRTRVVFARWQNVDSGGNEPVSNQPAGNELASQVGTGDEGGWIAGEVVQLQVTAGRRTPQDDKYWLPATALTRGSKGLWSVLVLPGDEPVARCVRRAVEVLKTDGSLVLVQGMLRPGERVIADGVHRITAGMRVRGLDRQPASADERGS
jgi:HlyD family secretion protein